MTAKRLGTIYCIAGIGVFLLIIGVFYILHESKYWGSPDFVSWMVMGLAAGMMSTIQGAGRLLNLDRGDQFHGRPVIKSLAAAGALSILATLFIKSFFTVDVFEAFVKTYSPIMFGSLALLNFILDLLLDRDQAKS